MLILRVALLAGFSSASLAAFAGSVLIDDFTTGNASVYAVVPGDVVFDDLPSGDLFAARRFTAHVLANYDPSYYSCLSASLGGGSLTYDCDFNVDASIQLDYTLSAVDLSAQRAIRVNCDELFLDLPFSVTVTSGGNSVTRAGVASAGSTGFTLDFTGAPSNPFDSGIDSISITVAPTLWAPGSKYFTLNSVEAVPEPTAFAALGLGALALMRHY